MAKKSLEFKLWEIGNEIEGLSPDTNGHGYKYLGLPKILSVLNPLLKEHKILLTKNMASCSTEQYHYTNAKGASKLETFALIEVEYTFTDLETGEKFTTKWFQEGANGMDKSVSSATTYCDRDFFIMFFNIANTEEDMLEGAAKEIVSSRPISKAELEEIKFLLKKNKYTKTKMLELFNKHSIDKIDAITSEKAQELITILEKGE